MKNNFQTSFEGSQSQFIFPSLSPRSQASLLNLDKAQKLMTHRHSLKHSPRLLPVCPLKLKLPETCSSFEFQIEGGSKSLWDPNLVFLPPIKSSNYMRSVPLLGKSVKKVRFVAKCMISNQLFANNAKSLSSVDSTSIEKTVVSLRIPNANQSARVKNEVVVNKKRQRLNRTSENEYSFGN